MTTPVYGWAVKGPEGQFRPETFNGACKNAPWTKAFYAWGLERSDLEHRGYRVVRVKIEEVESEAQD